MSDKFILLVEDDPDIRELLMEVFSLADITAVSAINGSDAIDKLKQMNKLPSLILLDLMMPKTDGLWFCEERKKFPNFLDIPVILLSADSQIDSKAKQYHIRGVLKKPVQIESLWETVKPYIL